MKKIYNIQPVIRLIFFVRLGILLNENFYFVNLGKDSAVQCGSKSSNPISVGLFWRFKVEAINLKCCRVILLLDLLFYDFVIIGKIYGGRE